MRTYCPYCRKEEEYYIEKRIFKEYKGVEVNIEQNVPICNTCKNELVINSIENENLRKIYEKYREIKNIIKVSEIINLRKKYNISQRELTAILDFGKMTINRYENGAIPSKTHSDYLRVIINDENEFINKAKEALKEKRISKRTINKIESAISHTQNDNQALKLYLEKELKTSPNIYNGFKEFDLDKLQNLISYLSSKVNLYLTSLNKYLWFIDMISFNKRTITITGLTYMHEQFGPVVYNRKYEEISKLENQYKREDIEKEDGSIMSKIVSKNNYDLALFSKEEIKIINEVINILKDKTVREISELSHNEKGWKETERYELISFEYANELKILK